MTERREMLMEYSGSMRRSVGKIIVAFGRLLSVFDPLIAVPSYFSLIWWNAVDSSESPPPDYAVRAWGALTR